VKALFSWLFCLEDSWERRFVERQRQFNYEAESSFAYHHINEVFEHWTFKKSRPLYPDEERDIKSQMTIEDGHLWIKDTAYAGMYWWERIVAESR
jgi:hypothetical protein